MEGSSMSERDFTPYQQEQLMQSARTQARAQANLEIPEDEPDRWYDRYTDLRLKFYKEYVGD
jgi:hypothetical protein